MPSVCLPYMCPYPRFIQDLVLVLYGQPQPVIVLDDVLECYTDLEVILKIRIDLEFIVCV